MQGPNHPSRAAAMHGAKQTRKAIARKQQSEQRRAEKGKTKAREAAMHRQERSRERAMRKLKKRKRRKWMGRNRGM